MASSGVGHLEIDRTAGLGVGAVFCQEQGLTGAADLQKQRKIRFKLVLPIHGEPELVNIKRQAASRLRDAQLRYDGLRHVLAYSGCSA